MICPICNIDFQLVDLIQIGNDMQCASCIKIQRQARLDGWSDIKTSCVSACQLKLTELDSISVLNKVEMLSKLSEIQNSLLQMKYYCERD